MAEPTPAISVQFDYLSALYEDILQHYGVRIGLRHARKHLGWGLDVAAATAGVPTDTLKHWRRKILVSEQPAEVRDYLDEAFTQVEWSAAA